MSDERRDLQFDGLNWLGQAVLLAGQLARTGASLIETAVDQAAVVISEASRAFQEGLDRTVEEAKILEEYEEPRGKP